MGYIFVDESGDTGLRGNSRQFFVYGFMYSKKPDLFRSVLRYYLNKLHTNNSYPPKLKELKFTLPLKNLRKKYSEMELDNYKNNIPKIRNQVINLINGFADGVFASAIDKTTITHSSWEPETICNYIFKRSLQDHILTSVENPVIFFDSGRLDLIKESDFRHYLHRECNGLGINAVRSHNEPCIWAADYIAGAFYHKIAFNNA